jgi:hypothetical protein
MSAGGIALKWIYYPGWLIQVSTGGAELIAGTDGFEIAQWKEKWFSWKEINLP